MPPNPSCPDCCDQLRRTKRSISERLRFSAVYSCKTCGHRHGVSRLDIWKISRFARCPDCHNSRLRILKRRDYIDRFNRNPFRLLQVALNAPLYHCSACRLQFYDLRKLESEIETNRAGQPVQVSLRDAVLEASSPEQSGENASERVGMAMQQPRTA
jgi:DNA-directed RNA polymerase subunit RPC12/RpoP